MAFTAAVCSVKRVTGVLLPSCMWQADKQAGKTNQESARANQVNADSLHVGTCTVLFAVGELKCWQVLHVHAKAGSRQKLSAPATG